MKIPEEKSTRKVWSIAEKQLTLDCIDGTRDVFMARYIKELGMPDKLSRIDSLWHNRQAILAEVRVVTPPQGKLVEPAITNPRKDPEAVELLVRLTQLVAEIVQINKDTLTELKNLVDKQQQTQLGVLSMVGNQGTASAHLGKLAKLDDVIKGLGKLDKLDKLDDINTFLCEINRVQKVAVEMRASKGTPEKVETKQQDVGAPNQTFEMLPMKGAKGSG